MKCLVVLCGLMAVASATPGAVISYSYANPAGVTFRGTGAALPIGVAQPAVPVAAPVAPVAPAPVQYAHPAPVQYAAAAPVQYAHPAPVAHAPVGIVNQQVGYVNQQVVSQVPGVANVPVTKLALTQGVTQKLVDVAQPAVKNRRVKVRRPALRKEFYDIEHRVIVRPAGSATLELSQPISKEQKGPAVITPTDYQQLAPVVRYGTARQIIDGQGVSPLAATRVALARGALPPAGPAPGPQSPPPQQPDFGRSAPQEQAQSQPQPQPQPQLRAGPRRPLQLRPQGAPQQQQQQAPPQVGRASDDAIEINAEQQQPNQQNDFQQQLQQQQQNAFQQLQQQQQNAFQQLQQQQQNAFQEQQNQQPQSPPPQPQQPQPQPQQASPQQGRALPESLQALARANGLTISPDMPIELQGRLLELLSAKGGTVTEVLNENGQPANSASVLQVADALQDVSLQGGERITTRRIVVTRPIETVQEVDIQEPATKIHRLAVNTPTLFKTPVQGVAQVPVSKTVVQNVATPFVKTSISPAYASAPAYAPPAYAYGK